MYLLYFDIYGNELMKKYIKNFLCNFLCNNNQYQGIKKKK